MDTLRERVAGELRATLARRRISAAELARRLGWSQSYMARRVDGRQPLDLDDLERIADVLGVTVFDLIPGAAVTTGKSYSDPIAVTPTVPHAIDPRSPRSIRSRRRGPVVAAGVAA